MERCTSFLAAALLAGAVALPTAGCFPVDSADTAQDVLEEASSDSPQDDTGRFSDAELEAEVDTVAEIVGPFIFQQDGGYVLDRKALLNNLDDEAPSAAMVIRGELAPSTAEEYLLRDVVYAFETAQQRAVWGWLAWKVLQKATCGAAKAFLESHGYECPIPGGPFPVCLPVYIATCARGAS